MAIIVLMESVWSRVDSLPLLKIIADILAEEPDTYNSSARTCYLKRWHFHLQYAAIDRIILEQPPNFYSCCKFLLLANYSMSLTYFHIKYSSNNILAIEYLKALKRRNSVISNSDLIPRAGGGYHDTAIHAPSENCATFEWAALPTNSIGLRSDCNFWFYDSR